MTENNLKLTDLIDESQNQMPFDSGIRTLSEMQRSSIDLLPVNEVPLTIMSEEEKQELKVVDPAGFGETFAEEVKYGTAKAINNAINNPEMAAVKGVSIYAATALGAAGGATVGSIIPFIGTAAGGFLGGVIGAIGGAMVPTNKQQLGGLILTANPDSTFGKSMAIEGLKEIEIFEENYGAMTDAEKDYWGAMVGSGTVSMAQFALGGATGKVLGLSKKGIATLTGIMAGGAGFHQGMEADLQAYIDETGDYDLENYRPTKTDLAINMVSGAAQGGVEAAFGPVGRLLPKGRLARIGATVVQESISNGIEEFAQGQFSGLAETLKGNQDWNDYANQQGEIIDGAIVGALLGGVMAPFSYEASRKNTKQNLSMKLLEYHPEIGKENASKAAELIVSNIENKTAQVVNDEVVAAVDASDDFGRMKTNFRVAIKRHLEERELDLDMAEEDLALLIENEADIQTRRAFLDSVERGISLSEHPMMKAQGDKTGVYIEGVDILSDDNRVGIDIKNDQVKEIMSNISMSVVEQVAKNPSLRKSDIETLQKKAEQVEARTAKEEARIVRAETRAADRESVATKKPRPINKKDAVKKEINGLNRASAEKIMLEINPETTPQFLTETQIKDFIRTEIDSYMKLRENTDMQGGAYSKSGDITRGTYDRELRRIILNENSDSSTIGHEMAHYWVSRNFSYFKSGFSSAEYEEKWKDIFKWLGVSENQMKNKSGKLTKAQSEKFARAYELFIQEGTITNEELRPIFEKHRDFVQEVYEDTESYFDMIGAGIPKNVQDWFNMNETEGQPEIILAKEVSNAFEKIDKATSVKEPKSEEFNVGEEATSDYSGGVKKRTGLDIQQESYKRRDMKLAAQEADIFVEGNEELALEIIREDKAEQGLLRSELIKALERKYSSLPDDQAVIKLNELVPYADLVARETGRELSGFRNFGEKTDVNDYLQAMKRLEPTSKANNKIEKEAINIKQEIDLFGWDESIDDKFLSDMECK